MRKDTYREKRKGPGGRLVLLVISGILVLSILLFLFLFRVSTVTVEGNIHYTEDEVKAMVMDGMSSGNSLILSMTKKEEKIENVPFMDSISVEMTGRTSVRIVVSEKNVVGYVEYENACWYFDRDGMVVEKSGTPVLTAAERVAAERSAVKPNEDESGNTQAEGGNTDGVVAPREDSGDGNAPGEDAVVPETAAEDGMLQAELAEAPVKNFVPSVRGLTFDRIETGRQLDIPNPNIFNTLSSLNQMINKDNIPPDYVQFDENSNIYLYYGTVEVRLGKDEKLEEKMNTLASIMPETQGLSGVLHLENYSEIENGVIFQKNS